MANQHTHKHTHTHTHTCREDMSAVPWTFSEDLSIYIVIYIYMFISGLRGAVTFDFAASWTWNGKMMNAPTIENRCRCHSAAVDRGSDCGRGCDFDFDFNFGFNISVTSGIGHWGSVFGGPWGLDCARERDTEAQNDRQERWSLFCLFRLRPC